jgi:hypothetical protein
MVATMKDEGIKYKHAVLLQQATQAGVTVEDVATVLASNAGDLDAFLNGRDENNLGHGPYAHYLLLGEDLFEKAIVCARARSAAR